MTTAVIEPDVPHVYAAIAEVLKHLSVEKNGMLPGNMGGKPYIAAHDIAAEVKRKFVENNLILTQSERVVKHEILTLNNRITVAMVISADYRFISTVDGSALMVTGVGDGLANGTAVASNIASTNAMKNGLLRAFLITEQSVEDYAKSGIDETVPQQPKAVAQASQGTTRAPAQAAKAPDHKALQDQIKAKVQEVKAQTGVEVDYAAIGNRLNPGDNAWPSKVTALKAVLKAIDNGEVK